MNSRLTSLLSVLAVAIGGTLLTTLLFIITISPTGPVTNTPLENIDGITYPIVNNATIISESFAHTDVLINSSRFGKALQITIAFQPGNADTLAVAVRENSFWFSYHPVTFYSRAAEGASSTPVEKTITIPLTDKIQDKDQSIDVIFFAQNSGTPITPDHNRAKDTVTWQVNNVTFTTTHVSVSYTEAKQFLRRVIHKERPI